MDVKNYISSGIIEAYVMGLCSNAEKTDIELNRRKYPEVDEAIVQYEKEIENNLLNNPTDPGDEVDERILMALNSLPAPVIDIDSNSRKIKTAVWLRVAAAAAVLLLLASVVFNFILVNKINKQEVALREKEQYSPLPVSDYNVLKEPSITPVAMYGVPPYTLCRCTLFWNKTTGKGYIMIHHLIPSTPGNKYQLWAMVNGRPVNVGLVHDEIRDRFIEVSNVPAGATGFMITLEKEGQSETPTLEQTFVRGEI